MNISTIAAQSSYCDTSVSSASNKKSKAEETKNDTTKCDSYVKSDTAATDSTKQIYSSSADRASVIKQLEADAEQRNQQLTDLVFKTLGKQANTCSCLSEVFEKMTDGSVPLDPQVVAQAKKDVADDGYWGATQTSDRLVSLAQALSGGDPTKADEMIVAVQKGFEQATSAWGKDLPDLCKQTLDATIQKLTDWKNGITSSEEE